MDINDKKIKQRSWPAVKAFCKRALSIHSLDINEIEKVYVGGKKFDVVFKKRMLKSKKVFFEKIICCPNTPLKELKKARSSYGSLDMYIDSMLPVDNYIYYFGINKYFDGNEENIHDVLFPLGYERRNLDKKSLAGKKSIDQINSRRCENILPYLGRYRVHPLDQSWRHISVYMQYLGLLPASLEKYDNRKHGKKLIWLCWVEWAHQNPKLCDENVLKLSSLIREHFLSTKVSPVLRSAYRAVIKSRYKHYEEVEAPGGRLHGLIEFSSAQRLKAVLPLLEESTRYPYEGDMDDGIIRTLPPYMNSICGRVLHQLWWSGVVFDQFEKIDSKTLYVSVPIGLSLNMASTGATAITYNLLNFKSKIESDDLEPKRGDDIFVKADAAQAKNIWCIEPLKGKPQYFVNNLKSRVKYGKIKGLDKLYDASEGASVYLPKMMSKFYKELNKNSVVDDQQFDFKVGVDKY